MHISPLLKKGLKLKNVGFTSHDREKYGGFEAQLFNLWLSAQERSTLFPIHCELSPELKSLMKVIHGF